MALTPDDSSFSCKVSVSFDKPSKSAGSSLIEKARTSLLTFGPLKVTRI